jgi:hypothetical protein
MTELREFEQKHGYKLVGAGLSTSLVDLCPNLPPLLWGELDIVPFVFGCANPWTDYLSITIDEEADAMARRCVG